MSRIRKGVRAYGLDVLVALLALAAMAEIALQRDAPTAPRTTLWLVFPAVALMVLPVFARRRFPFAAPAMYWLLAVALSFADGRLIVFTTSVFVIGMATAFLLGNLGDGVLARVGLAAVAGGVAIIVYNKPAHTTGELVFFPLLFAICWLGGFALRERAEQAQAAEGRAVQAEREREAAARLAVAEERARVARELHDIVAHAVSVMVLQVGAVRHRLPQSLEEDAEALRGVERAGRTALTEMRRLLAAMREDGEVAELGPHPGLDSLDTLLDDVGRAGLPVRLHVDGERFPLPRPIDLSAYRIVQEGLTNSLKHARAGHAHVTLRYRPEELELVVADDGAGPAHGDGLGHGLVGIRERVKIYGGEVSAGAAPGGGFVLSARLPLDRRRP